jgi:hypothetical protein
MTGASGRIVSIMLCLLFPGAVMAQEPVISPPPQEQQSSPSRPFDRQNQEDKASQDILNRNHLPNSPGAAKPIEELPPASKTALQTQPQEPTGTAAAPAARISGSAASQPAGVAIAPAKQHQVRSILIKVGALAGAGIALGTVYGLSKASPSTPPGSH